MKPVGAIEKRELDVDGESFAASTIRCGMGSTRTVGAGAGSAAARSFACASAIRSS